MQIHQLKREHPRRKARQIGRGGKRGKTAGRGTKGQLARAGHKLRPELRDILKKLPKRRGFGKNRAQTVDASLIKPAIVKLGQINKVFDAGATINPAALLERNLIRRRRGLLPAVKILSGGLPAGKTGASAKLFNFIGCLASGAARLQIEQAGGTLA